MRKNKKINHFFCCTCCFFFMWLCVWLFLFFCCLTKQSSWAAAVVLLCAASTNTSPALTGTVSRPPYRGQSSTAFLLLLLVSPAGVSRVPADTSSGIHISQPPPCSSYAGTRRVTTRKGSKPRKKKMLKHEYWYGCFFLFCDTTFNSNWIEIIFYVLICLKAVVPLRIIYLCLHHFLYLISETFFFFYIYIRNVCSLFIRFSLF